MTRKEANEWLQAQLLPARSWAHGWLWFECNMLHPNIPLYDNHVIPTQLEIRAFPSNGMALRLPAPGWKEVGRDA